MTLTPTAQSSVVAGFALWLVGWATFFHVDQIPYINKFVNKEKVLQWILSHKVLTLLLTELVNFSVHPPTNPAVTLFAIGGSIFNTMMIFIFLPVNRWKKRKSNRQVLQGAC